MASQSPTKVAILGAGRGGTALLDLLHQIRTIEIVGIADQNPNAPGLQRARELNVPVYERVADLIGNNGVNLVMNVTGDPAMERVLHTQVPVGADILSGPASRILWELVQHESALQAELLHAEKLAGIGSFAAGIAHDMNNPLQLILGLAENLTEERDLNEVHLQARDIIEAVKRTTAICRDLTSYSRRASSLQDGMIAINTKLDEALRIARYAVALQDIEIRKSYTPDVTVKGNPDELLHVFVNLITNAVQAMEHGGTVTLETAIADGATQVRVSDTGCGIPQELLGQIFDPFFTTKPPGKGSGMGLSMVHGLVRAVGGHFRVESPPGGGATFHVYLPTAGAAAVTLPGAAAPAAGTVAGARRRVLLVDDEAAILRLLCVTLESEGWSVSAHSHPLTALEEFQDAPHAFTALISDQAMPDMTGIELIQAVLRLRPDLPALLCTGYSERLDEAGARRLGVRRFFLKPVDGDALVAALEAETLSSCSPPAP